jgi:hypothetical protein
VSGSALKRGSRTTRAAALDAVTAALQGVDGRPRSEIARLAGLDGQTAAEALSGLVEAGRVRPLACPGRYFGLRSQPPSHRGRRRPPRRLSAEEEARVCCGHLAGRLGVELTDRLVAGGVVARTAEGLELTDLGRDWSRSNGLRLGSNAGAAACLDRSERRFHVGGSFGRALLERLLELGIATRAPASRVVVVRPEAARRLGRLDLAAAESQEQD